MEVHLNSELQAKLERLALETGRPVAKLIEDAVAGYLDELLQTQDTLNGRYDDLKSGRTKPIDGEEAFTRLMEQTESPEPEAELAALRSAIDEGDASGVAKGDVFARVRKTRKLPESRR